MVNNICYVLGTSGPSFFFMSVSPDVIRLLLCIPRSFLSAFLLSVFSNELFPCRFSGWCIGPFPRTSLNDLHSLAHSEVVSVFSELPFQALYRYNQFCYHSRGCFVSFAFAYRSHIEHHHCVREVFLKTDAKVR